MSHVAAQLRNAVRSIIEIPAGWCGMFVHCRCCSQENVHKVEHETLHVARTGETRNKCRIL